MTVEGFPQPLTDSLDISYWFCSVYPRLLPAQHESFIQRILREIHSIEGLSLSAARPKQPQEDVVNPACDTILVKHDINEQYREALQYKKLV